MTYKLWIDDDALKENIDSFRKPPSNEINWKIATTIKEAKVIIRQFGIPEFIEFDHDLGLNVCGGTETAMDFLEWLEYHFPDAIDSINGWNVHSKNPVGAKNIESFMSSWKKSRTL